MGEERNYGTSDHPMTRTEWEAEPLSEPPAQWKGDLSEREQIQIAHAQEYARIWGSAGVPGHGQFLLIAKLAKKLDDLEYAHTHPLRGPE